MVWWLSACLVFATGHRFFLVGCAAFALGVRAAIRRDREALCFALLAVVCAGVGVGAAARQERDVHAVERAAARAGAAAIELRGRVADFPRTNDYGTSFAFATAVEGRPLRLLVRAPFFDVSYGDRYLMRVRLIRPSPATRAYLDAQGLAGTGRVRFRDAHRLTGRDGNALAREALWPLHRFARTRLARALGDRAAFPGSLLLGERGQLDARTRDAFRRLGIQHLIAISGMHLTTVAACALLLVRPIPRAGGVWVLLALSVYTGVVGSVESLTRAYTMAVLLIASRLLVRPLRPVDALGKAMLLMALASPLSMRSPGLQMSCAATFAVLWILPVLRVLFPPAPSASIVRRVAARAWAAFAGAVVLSLAVECFIAPIQLHHFGRISLVGAPATALFVAPVSAVLVGAIAACALADVPVLGSLSMHALGWASDSTCRLAVALAAALPDPAALPEPNALLYYAGVCAAWRARRRPLLWPLALAAVAISFFIG